MQSTTTTQTTVQLSPPQSASTVPSSGRLKYAEPRDLPSFPSLGLRKDDAAASAAATLGWASQKPSVSPAGLRPQNASTASAAALLAKDHKPAPSWSPIKSDIGSRAALVATARKTDVVSSPSAPSLDWGSSAANQAYKASSIRSLAVHSSETDNSGSLRAAKDAMGRPRAFSSPGSKHSVQSVDGHLDAGALTAATAAHKRTTLNEPNSSHSPAASHSFMNMDRQMFTSHPPIQIRDDDLKHNEVMHASAVAMAKRMYTQQQQLQQQQQRRDIDAAAKLAQGSSELKTADSTAGQSPQYANLQEAAYKLAQDRLAKLQEEYDRTRERQVLYRASPSSPTSYKRLISKGKLRRRSSSDGAAPVGQDLPHAARRATVMSPNSKRQQVSAADEDKRRRDHEALLAAAKRNVQAQLDGIDRKLMEETGMVSPSLRAGWETKAQAIARARSNPEFVAATTPSSGLGIDIQPQGKSPKSGMVDVGGGKYMDQAEIDEIAAKRVQPFLDEINEKAEKERERLAKIKAEQDARREAEELEKAKEREIKQLHEKIKAQQKDQEKARKEEIKNEERERLRLEKEAKLEQKDTPKEKHQNHHHLFLTKKTTNEVKQQQTQSQPQQQQQQQQQVVSQPTAETTNMGAPSSAQEPSDSKKGRPSRGRSLHLRLPSIPLTKSRVDKGKEIERTPQSASASFQADEPLPEEDSQTSAKVKNWIKSRFRPRAKSSIEPTTRKGGFIGGAALAARHGRAASNDSESTTQESIREVALAGRAKGTSSPQPAAAAAATAAAQSTVSLPTSAAVSSLSVVSNSSSSSTKAGSDHFVLARDHMSPGPLSPPPTLRDPALGPAKSASPVRDSRFLEMMDS